MDQHILVKAFFDSGPVGQGILIVLVLLSIIAWGVIFEKVYFFRNLKSEGREFLNYFHTKAKSKIGSVVMDILDNNSLHNRMYLRGYQELKQITEGYDKNQKSLTRSQLTDIEISLKGVILQEGEVLERNIIILATAANVAPLLGLLGTVYGLLDSFFRMGQMGSASIENIGPGIAEALVTTIFGLFVAIPSAVGYNYILNTIKNFMADMENYMGEFMSLLEKGHFD